MAYISFQPKDYFNTKLYAGNATDNTAITGVGFQPDWLWGKNRTDSTNHYLIDAVRGITKNIKSQSSSAEATDTAVLKSFDSDGFTLGDGSLNQSSHTFVTWNWKANGAGSSNTDGSITSTVSANTTSGFSIVKWTGTGASATVGHGLGVTPDMIICKNLDGTAEDWVVWNNSFSASQFIRLNTTASVATSTGMWDNTLPTSSVFSLKNEEKNNNTGQDIIAYCFADVQGFSKVSGSYVGNGNADGAFIYTGFKPAFIIIKNADDGSKNWVMLDNKRPSTGQNPADDILFPNTSGAESSSQTDRLVDFVSNGVKIRATSLQMNGSGNTHIFMAFAEEPLVSSNGVPNTAK